MLIKFENLLYNTYDIYVEVFSGKRPNISVSHCTSFVFGSLENLIGETYRVAFFLLVRVIEDRRVIEG